MIISSYKSVLRGQCNAFFQVTMSRPKILAASGNHVKLEVPSGWFTTLSVVSRKPYNQLVTCDFVVQGDAKNHFIVNKYGQNSQTMRDLDSTEDILPIIPQNEPVVIDINVYFSTKGSVKEDALKNDSYKSSRLNILGTQKPANAPKDFPDYNTYLIFVEDAPPTIQVQGAPEYDDSLITINIIQGLATAPKPDTSSQAIAQTGKEAINNFLNQYTDPSKPGPTIPDTDIKPPPPQPASPYPVGILGAGVSGLYAAMMLQSLGIKYEIMEGSGRTGGRLYTHYFPKNPGKYQYYDVGAMRYPETTFMTRTFDLARKRLGINMIPYIRSDVGDDPFFNFNGRTVTRAQSNAANLVKDDLFKVTEKNDGNVPEVWFNRGSGYFWDTILGQLRDNFKNYPFAQAFEMLKEWEEHSVTSYLMLIHKVPYPVIKWWESVESRTGLFDQSLTETVLASLVFMDPNVKNPNWFCFDGGSEVVHKAMVERLNVKPQHYMRAVIIKDSDDGKSITVTFNTERNPRPQTQTRTEKKYSNVISTMSLACLRMVDLDNLYLSYGQRNAIRQLMYTPSIKIGLQFKKPWWEDLNIVGGQSSTDRPIRDVVYPSYGPDDSHPGSQKSNCMIAAYNGMQDAQRLGGLMKGRDTPEEKVLLDIVMRDLAALHNQPVDKLWDLYEDYYPWDFYRDEFQLGAFCQFGPGQFQYTYPYVTQPASKDQRFHFAGDATSTFHGWVAGALNSAWRAVLGMLLAHPELNPNPGEDIIAKFKREWGDSEEWDQRDLAKHVYVGREVGKINRQNS
ncbi:L-amino acid oxidase [Crucibulum laeve]|uniref:L-amino acid oxidase n=1 Tax=Crucibulum laeve TaxID=68775 RepID=A0A5C3LQA8_9AGAR|nr:L-amino acid oxidase [Crucibulum laeve]